MAVIKVFRPMVPDQILILLLLQFPIWLANQFTLIPPILLTDSSHGCLSSRVLSIRLNRNVLSYLKFDSGGLSHLCYFRFLTNEFSLDIWFGEVIWVFDPGIRQTFLIERIGCCDNFLFLRTRSDDDDDVLVVPRSNYSGFMEKEIMVTNRQRWVESYERHDPESFQATYQRVRLIIVTRKAFGSFIYKMIAFYEYMKRGLNRFHLLHVRLPFGKQSYFHFFIVIMFNFLYLVQ
ncbi:unnamed protein product [Arabidopsis lyrata]|uniref:Predicted protein n=1 Tax=Arabidopsis lyrata subsp. lyrata TaxID=81972 RepID=D7KXD0_ARALL|nr:predicted protein [Arabidopsis lyrata subsp. lyrata]CAH8256406.1 unnamed protein product [Arabidopsis lyrata]